jgi:large subunit ribosomal protein L17
MKKKVFGRKLGRSRPAREALFASLARSMILNGKIVTTKAKAKAVQVNLEKFVRLAKTGEIASLRRVLADLDNARDAMSVLTSKIVPVFTKKISGFTRIISLPARKGDGSQMVRIEWTEKIVEEDKKAKAKEEVKNKKNAKDIPTKRKRN